MRKRRLTVVATLILLGIAVRVFAAWCMAYSPSADHGVASLMALHVSECHELPVFFYGQPYLGAIEPIICGLFLKLFGVSGFVVNLGTAFFGMLLLPVVYLWGRDAAGHKAGVAALIYCLVGSPYYFQYQSWGNGGYAASMLTGAFVLWHASRIAGRQVNGIKVAAWQYVVLGLVAGIGWWTSQIIIAALAAAALVLAVSVPLKKWLVALPLGLVGFVAGGLPFWIWNAKNDWGTFRWMLRFTGETSLGDGVKLVATKRLPGMLDLASFPGAASYTLIVLYVLIVILCLAALAMGIRRFGRRGRVLRIALPLLYVVAFIVTYALSSHVTHNTPRYGLPLVPAIAILLGIATAALIRKLKWGFAWIPLILLVMPHLAKLPEYPGWRREHLERYEKAEELMAFLREKDIECVYAPFQAHPFNFMFKEEVCFSNLLKERYLPYKVKRELSGGIAVLENHGDVHSFLRAMDVKPTEGMAGGFRVHYDLAPSLDRHMIAPPSLWSSAMAGSTPVTDLVNDGDINTQLVREGGETVEIRLRDSVPVSGIRVLAGDGAYPANWEIHGMVDGEWRRISRKMKTQRYYWAGDRLYWDYDFYRLEGRCRVVETDRLKIKFTAGKRKPEIRLAEIQVLMQSRPSQSNCAEALSDLMAVLREHGVARLYCDRWAANRVHEEGEGKIATSRRITLNGPSEPLTTRMSIADGTAILARHGDADQCQMALTRAGLKVKETVIGPWTMFEVENAEDQTRALHWAGFSCFLDSSRGVRSSSLLTTNH